jgi:hypothetical protein
MMKMEFPEKFNMADYSLYHNVERNLEAERLSNDVG